MLSSVYGVGFSAFYFKWSLSAERVFKWILILLACRVDVQEVLKYFRLLLTCFIDVVVCVSCPSSHGPNVQHITSSITKLSAHVARLPI